MDQNGKCYYLNKYLLSGETTELPEQAFFHHRN